MGGGDYPQVMWMSSSIGTSKSVNCVSEISKIDIAYVLTWNDFGSKNIGYVRLMFLRSTSGMIVARLRISFS